MKNKIKLLPLFFFLLININCQQSNGVKSPYPNAETASDKIIILAIDGGGIKGIIPATFLQAIEDSLGKASYKLFDVIGGTSTGGIIATALTSPNIPAGKNLPFTAAEITDIYKNDGAQIFVPQNKSEETAIYYSTDSTANPFTGIEPYLQSILGSTTKLSDGSKFMQGLIDARVKQMFTTSYIINSSGGVIRDPVRNADYGPYLFNWHNAGISFSEDYYLWEAARATSAAPVYFPVGHVGGDVSPRSNAAEKWVVDGGTMSNNPALWGLSEAFRTGLATELEDIIIISLGTGNYPGIAGAGITNNASGDGNWGEIPWLIADMNNLEGSGNVGTLLDVILDAVQMVTTSQLQALQSSGLKYYRLEPTLTLAQEPMDSIGSPHVDSLILTAQNYLQTEGNQTFLNIIDALRTN